MFSQKQRLNSRLVSKIIKTGKKIFNKHFRASFIENEDFRVSVVIPKKILKRRIDRNREKRRITHIIKSIYKEKKISSYIIISLQKDTQLLSGLNLKNEIKNIMSKIVS